MYVAYFTTYKIDHKLLLHYANLTPFFKRSLSDAWTTSIKQLRALNKHVCVVTHFYTKQRIFSIKKTLQYILKGQINFSGTKFLDIPIRTLLTY